MCPKTIRPWDNVPRRQYAPGQSALETICPKDIMPRRQSAPETTCPKDNMPLETTCPGDNLPRRQHAPRQYAAETSCPRRQYAPGDNLPQETMCPGDNVPHKTMCPRDNVPQDNVPRETIVDLEQYRAKRFHRQLRGYNKEQFILVQITLWAAFSLSIILTKSSSLSLKYARVSFKYRELLYSSETVNSLLTKTVGSCLKRA